MSKLQGKMPSLCFSGYIQALCHLFVKFGCSRFFYTQFSLLWISYMLLSPREFLFLIMRLFHNSQRFQGVQHHTIIFDDFKVLFSWYDLIHKFYELSMVIPSWHFEFESVIYHYLHTLCPNFLCNEAIMLVPLC